MRLVMVGLDYTTAGMEAREAFSPAASDLPGILRSMFGGDVLGCALIATCNRTELYISHNSDVPPDGVGLLCRAFGRDERLHAPHFRERHERQAATHLMRVAAGMASSVPGDAQIITQVRTAIEAAREAETSDALLESLFRSAVTAGKKVKTRVDLTREGASVASEALAALAGAYGEPAGKTVLVIGNGVIGRLAAAGLAEKGCRVFVTLRKHSKGRLDAPAGCRAVDYDDRYAYMERCDYVVSATSSPHHTVERERLEGLRRLPELFLDLAVPRDVDPAVTGLNGTAVWNIDDLPSTVDEAERERRRAVADDIIAEEAARFDTWRRNRQRRAQRHSGSPDFPVFISLHGATVLIAGGGKVAARRAEKVLAFGAKARVATPALSPEMRRLVDDKRIEWIPEPYRPQHLEGATLAIAATDRREVNRQIGLDARERGILVSVADKRQECTFYFPAVVKSDLLTAGVISNNGDHVMVRKAAAQLRREMDAIDENYSAGNQGEPSGCGAGAACRGRHKELRSRV